MKMDEKSGRLQYLYNEAHKLLSREDATAEDLEQADGYIKEATGLRDEIAKADVRTESMKGLEDYIKASDGRQGVLDTHETKVERSVKGNGGFETFGEFLIAARGRRDPRLVPDKKFFNQLGQKALAEAVGVDGGVLVPHDYRPNLLALEGPEAGVVRPRATVIPMTARSLSMPALDQTADVGGTQKSAYHAGVYVEWTEEAAQKPEVELSFREIELVVHKMTAYMQASDELLADCGLALEALLTRLMSSACAFQEDYSFLRGDGVGKPLGVLNSPALQTVARAGADGVTYADLVGLLTLMLPGARPVWVMNQGVLPELYTMVDGNSNYIWRPAEGVGAAAVGGAPGTVLGLPVVFTEKLPYLGTEGDVLLADFSYYLIGDRQAVTIASSVDERFRYDQTSWRVVQRVDGQPWLSGPIYSIDDTSVFSPFVALTDAS